jgi:hypothetical protein
MDGAWPVLGSRRGAREAVASAGDQRGGWSEPGSSKAAVLATSRSGGAPGIQYACSGHAVRILDMLAMRSTKCLGGLGRFVASEALQGGYSWSGRFAGQVCFAKEPSVTWIFEVCKILSCT